MNPIMFMAILIILFSFFGMFYVLYTGESKSKYKGIISAIFSAIFAIIVFVIVYNGIYK